MNRDLSNRINQYLNNDPTKKQEDSIHKRDEHHDRRSSVKTICFVLENGREVFLNYNYLVSGEYDPEGNSILLYFTSHIVVIKGNNMNLLFEDLMLYTPKKIIAKNKRYESISPTNESFISDITIDKIG